MSIYLNGIKYKPYLNGVAYTLYLNGVKYGDSGSQTPDAPVRPKVYERVACIGNSFTQIPGGPNQSWAGTYGMAATRIENDYVHLLQTALRRKQRDLGTDETSVVIPIGTNTGSATFESGLNGGTKGDSFFDGYLLAGNYNKQSSWNHDILKDCHLDGTEDLVIIRLGENNQYARHDGDSANFKAGYRALVDYLLKKCPNAKIVFTACIWGGGQAGMAESYVKGGSNSICCKINNAFKGIVDSIASDRVTYVEMADLDEGEAMRASEEDGSKPVYNDSGEKVALYRNYPSMTLAHPGDKGMKMICNRILENIGMEEYRYTI